MLSTATRRVLTLSRASPWRQHWARQTVGSEPLRFPKPGMMCLSTHSAGSNNNNNNNEDDNNSKSNSNNNNHNNNDQHRVKKIYEATKPLPVAAAPSLAPSDFQVTTPATASQPSNSSHSTASISSTDSLSHHEVAELDEEEASVLDKLASPVPAERTKVTGETETPTESSTKESGTTSTDNDTLKPNISKATAAAEHPVSDAQMDAVSHHDMAEKDEEEAYVLDKLASPVPAERRKVTNEASTTTNNETVTTPDSGKSGDSDTLRSGVTKAEAAAAILEEEATLANTKAAAAATPPPPLSNMRSTITQSAKTPTEHKETASTLPREESVPTTLPVLPLPREACPSVYQVALALAQKNGREAEFVELIRQERTQRFFLWQKEVPLIQATDQLFQAILRQSENPKWFGPGRVSRDFRPRHALRLLHYWLIKKRLELDDISPNKAAAIQNKLLEAFYDDIKYRIRALGDSEWTVNKQHETVETYSATQLHNYNACYEQYSDQPEKRLEALRQIVWFEILGAKENLKTRYDHIDRFVWYIDAQYQNIVLEWPDEFYRQARLCWIDLPDFSNIKDVDGSVLTDKSVHPDDVVPSPWFREVDPKGKEFFWNAETGATSRRKPV